MHITFFWLHLVFIAVHRLSLVAVSRDCSLLQSAGFSLRCLLWLWSTGSRCTGFSSCGAWAQELWCMGLSSWTRDRTRVPCIGRRILNHSATREVPDLPSLWHLFFIDAKKILCWIICSNSQRAIRKLLEKIKFYWHQGYLGHITKKNLWQYQ